MTACLNIACKVHWLYIFVSLTDVTVFHLWSKCHYPYISKIDCLPFYVHSLIMILIVMALSWYFEIQCTHMLMESISYTAMPYYHTLNVFPNHNSESNQIGRHANILSVFFFLAPGLVPQLGLICWSCYLLQMNNCKTMIRIFLL